MALWGKNRSGNTKSTKQSKQDKAGLTFDNPLYAEDSNASQRLTEKFPCRACGSKGKHKMVGGSTWMRHMGGDNFIGYRIQVAECKQCHAVVPVVFYAYPSIQETIDGTIKSFPDNDELLGKTNGGFPTMIVARGPSPQEYLGLCLGPSDLARVHGQSFHFTLKSEEIKCANCSNPRSVYTYENGGIKCRECGAVAYLNDGNRKLDNVNKEFRDTLQRFGKKNPNKSEPFKWIGAECKKCGHDKYVLVEFQDNPLMGGVLCNECEYPIFLSQGDQSAELWNLSEEMLVAIKDNIEMFNREAGG